MGTFTWAINAQETTYPTPHLKVVSEKMEEVKDVALFLNINLFVFFKKCFVYQASAFSPKKNDKQQLQWLIQGAYERGHNRS